MGAVFDKVIGPDVVGVFWLQPDAGSVIEQRRPFFGCFCGTLSPSRRQIRSTRFLFTTQPASRSRAVMRREP